jgi:hypothetical protein
VIFIPAIFIPAIFIPAIFIPAINRRESVGFGLRAIIAALPGTVDMSLLP